jgi:hypothetical protein
MDYNRHALGNSGAKSKPIDGGDEDEDDMFAQEGVGGGDQAVAPGIPDYGGF